jgi:apolipoprotein N-acyltransferase
LRSGGSGSERGHGRPLVAGILSGGLLALGSPGFGLPALAWIALAPLCASLRAASARGALAGGTLAGLVFHALHVGWVIPAGTPVAGFALAATAVSLFFGLFALLGRLALAARPHLAVLSLPALWVALEYARVHLGWASSPWGLVGYSQYQLPAVTAVAALAGVYGVSFLIVAAGAALAALASGGALRPVALAGAGIAAGWTAALALPAAEVRGARRALEVALVQGGIFDPQRERSARDVFADYRDLTVEATRAGPALVVWPESAIAARLPGDLVARRRLGRVARAVRSPLLVGAGGRDKHAGSAPGAAAANSAFLFDAEGALRARYDKVRLLPFNEYLPLRDRVPWPDWLAPDGPDAVPGPGPTLFEAGDARFGVLICWENLFPDAAREQARAGAQFMVSLTNESFTRSPVAREQLLAINALRAAETGLAFVRAATTGISAVIEPDGAIRSRLTERGRTLDARGVLIEAIPLRGEQTPYTRFGDLFAGAACAGAALALVPRRASARGGARA